MPVGLIIGNVFLVLFDCLGKFVAAISTRTEIEIVIGSGPALLIGRPQDASIAMMPGLLMGPGGRPA